MCSVSYKKIAIFIYVLFNCARAFSVTPSVEKLVLFETKGNAIALRSSDPVRLAHLEIPLEKLGVDFADRMSPEIVRSLIFERDGQKLVRWILNPEDTQWGKEVIRYFRDQGLNLEPQYYFIGYQTASRSYVVEDPITGTQFSVKSSTNKTAGYWKDKKQTVDEAIDARLVTDFLHDQNKKLPFKNFIILDEPGILTLDAIDQAVVIRDLGQITQTENDKIYLPGFSALNEEVGREIALKNGSTDPWAYWTEHYVKPAGRALGELGARTGIQLESPHSQNFLIELDSNYRPTGRIVIRDFSDVYIYKRIVDALLGEDNSFLSRIRQKKIVIKDFMKSLFEPFKGNKKPSWFSEKKFDTWLDIFFDAFGASFKEESGFDLRDTKAGRTKSSDELRCLYTIQNAASSRSYFEQMARDGVTRNENKNQTLRCFDLFSVN